MSLRHVCSGCGGCCQGSIVHLINHEERDRVISYADQLGIDQPIDEGRLRLHDGKCAFLLNDRKCAIHNAFGESAKPVVCRQFPYVVIDTESGRREGIDPASIAWHTTRQAGDVLTPPPNAQARPAYLPEAQARVEQQLVTLCADERAHFSHLLGLLCASPHSPPGLPPGFTERWLQTIQAAPLLRLLDHPAVGPDHRSIITAMVHTASTFSSPPKVELTDGQNRDALDLVAATLHLRLITTVPIVQASALLLAGGVILSAWHDGSFAVSLSTWCRILRAGPFWQALTPTPAHLQWLATGQTPPGSSPAMP